LDEVSHKSVLNKTIATKPTKVIREMGYEVVISASITPKKIPKVWRLELESSLEGMREMAMGTRKQSTEMMVCVLCTALSCLSGLSVEGSGRYSEFMRKKTRTLQATLWNPWQIPVLQIPNRYLFIHIFK
jgi:hypothetical protein